MPEIPVLSLQHLSALCDELGHTTRGLTGSEIGRLLSQCGIPDAIGANKADRLYAALSGEQRRGNAANRVLAFVEAALDPVRYVSNRALFDSRRSAVNVLLSFDGIEISEDGKCRSAQQAHTISEAAQRASRLRSTLQSRQVHPDVLRFCREELLQDNYFHAVFEAAKSIADKIRNLSDLEGDGSLLVDKAFGKGARDFPLLVFNPYRTETDRSEHVGIMNLMKGLFGLFRNTTAHAPRISWVVSEQDALDMLTLASLLHRRLDTAFRTDMFRS